ncbi:hypothetical protein [Candidatus Marithrix sp. Canyon 246]|uniref:hypothetical protein n=1 Tax=Candidatus Marithrix sp. Canyon 246 TaxID=1827136 RepID=UPI00084A05C9|nr:hypothetical protein [Candidatus Marithrix sp. Canyon 246]
MLNELHDKTVEKSFSQSFTLKYDLKLGNGRFDIDSSDPLNDTADRVKTNACKFKTLCGYAVCKSVLKLRMKLLS